MELHLSMDVHRPPKNILRSCDRASQESFFIIKPNRYTNFPNLLRHETLHVSDISSAHHQEFIHFTGL